MLIGTAGHIDHGKTTLVKALTGVDADRLPEEKARGITLDLGYAYTALPDGSVLGFVDVPGHAKLIHNMLAGVTGIDFVLLVVAADDGPMPQTREHLELLDLLGLGVGAVTLTKCDRVDAARQAEAAAEVADLLAGSVLAGAPLFPVVAIDGTGIAALHAHLAAAAAHHRPHSTIGRFRLAIDRHFTLPGVGTVVTGTAHAGKISAGEAAVILPTAHGKPLAARVRSLHVQGRPAQHGQAGDRIALALAGDFGKEDIARGMWLIDPALAVPIDRFHGELRVPVGVDKGQKKLAHLQPVHVHLGTDDIMGRVVLLDCSEVSAGATALVEILLDRPTLALRGDRFILRDAAAQRTVAGGRVLDIFPPTRLKRSPARLALLDTLRADDPAAALVLLAAAPSGVDLQRFAINWNLAAADADELWQQAGLRVIGGAGIGFAGGTWEALAQKLCDALAHEHERAPDLAGVERERLRRMTGAHLPRAVFDALADELLATGRIAQSRAWLHLPAHRANVSAADRDLFATLIPLLDAAPYNPPRVRDICKASGVAEDKVRQLFKHMARAGALYPVAHDHYFTAAAVAELASIVRQLDDERGAARAAALRDVIYGADGGGRKVAIHILEFFDRIGYTRRVRDDHLLRRAVMHDDWLAP